MIDSREFCTTATIGRPWILIVGSSGNYGRIGADDYERHGICMTGEFLSHRSWACPARVPQPLAMRFHSPEEHANGEKGRHEEQIVYKGEPEVWNFDNEKQGEIARWFLKSSDR